MYPSQCLIPFEWLYCATIYPLPLSSSIMPRYIHPHSLVPWERLYHASVYQTLIIFSSLTIFGEGVIISWHHIFIPDDIGEVVIISWHYIFTPDNIWWGGDYIVTLYFHSWQHLVRGDYIVTLYFHSWKYLVRGWLLSYFHSWRYLMRSDYIVTLHYHSWHYPRIWHWRWLYLTIFTIQIWLCSDTRVLLFISVYSLHDTWEVKVMIFKHDILFAAETFCGYVNGLYQVCDEKNSVKSHRTYKKLPYCKCTWYNLMISENKNFPHYL